MQPQRSAVTITQIDTLGSRIIAVAALNVSVETVDVG